MNDVFSRPFREFAADHHSLEGLGQLTGCDDSSTVPGKQ
jgi:hypothetical protein